MLNLILFYQCLRVKTRRDYKIKMYNNHNIPDYLQWFSRERKAKYFNKHVVMRLTVSWLLGSNLGLLIHTTLYLGANLSMKISFIFGGVQYKLEKETD